MAQALPGGGVGSPLGGGLGGGPGGPGGGPGAMAGPMGSDRFSGNVRGQVIYASNVAGGDQAIADLRGIKPEDVTYDLGATVNLQLPSSRQTFFLTGSADVQRHERNSILDSESYNISGGGLERLGPCGVSLIASYSHYNTLIEDLTIATTKNTAEQEGVNGSVNCGRRSVFVGASAGFSKQTNSAKTAGFIDSQTTTEAISAGYQNNRLGNLVVSGQYSKTDYDKDSALLLNQPDGFNQYAAILTYSRKIGLRLSGNASVSVQTLKADATALSPAIKTTNLGSTATLNYRVSSRLGVYLSYNLSNQPSPTINADYIRVDSLRLGGSFALNQRISLHVNGARSKTGYKGGQPQILQVRESDDKEIDGGVSVKLGRKIVVSLDGTHTDRQADLPQFNFSSNQVTLGITSAF